MDSLEQAYDEDLTSLISRFWDWQLNIITKPNKGLMDPSMISKSRQSWGWSPDPLPHSQVLRQQECPIIPALDGNFYVWEAYKNTVVLGSGGARL